MFKLALSVVAVFAVTTLVIAEYEQENLFGEIFSELHKEPGAQLAAKADVKIKWLEQKLDNFNESETRTWQMRYMENGEFYQPGGPLFIFVGGEWEISAGKITTGHFCDMAKEHNGYLFYTEHRFYGDSMPVDAMTNENLQYLDVKQALADLAHFIRTIKTLIPGAAQSKTILAGGSYSATMVTWFKVLYPDLAVGCWASSAPLEAKADYFDYKKIMGQSIKIVSGDTCYNRIQRGIAGLESMLANKRGAEVKAMLYICNLFDEDNDLDVYTLFYEISEIFASLVQTHVNDNIQTACNRIMEGSTDVIGVANYIVDKFGAKGCVDFSYRSYLSTFTNTSKGNHMRAWTYQTCNEFGWFQTSTSFSQPFGTKYPMEYFSTWCGDAYGEQFTHSYIEKRITATNNMFGGLRPKVENVYWTHGQLDPWRAAGIEKGATIIPYHAHCKDFDSISDVDAPELKSSKENIAALVRKWLAQ